MTGYDYEELLQMTGPDLSHLEDKQIGSQEFWEVVNGKHLSYQVEKRYLHKDGSLYWVRLTVSGVRAKDGQLQYLICMTEDITSRKLAQEALRESEDRFRAIFENTSVGIALTGLDRKVIQVNEAAAQITGYSMDELTKIHPSDLSIPQDRLIGQEQLQEMIDGKREGMIVERRFKRKDGRIFWGRVTYSLVRDANGTPLYLIGLIEDISEEKLAAAKLAEQDMAYRRSLEQRVEERTRELSEANQRLVNEIEQRQLAEKALASKAAEEAIIAERTRLAHDLHDAVTQTLFSASLIAEVLTELWKLDPEEAGKSSEELRQLTRGALAEMRTLLLELRPAALSQARFPDLIKQLSEAAIGRARLPVSLSVNGEYELPPDIKVAFYRIAQESLNNIVKYSRAKQVEITILLSEQRVRLEIKDDGIGFDPANIKPTSLGMRIMRERAEAIHARLDISSSPGRGTFIQVEWDGNG
jgi:PAS domain S-box-containing protein